MSRKLSVFIFNYKTYPFRVCLCAIGVFALDGRGFPGASGPIVIVLLRTCVPADQKITITESLENRSNAPGGNKNG